jgi:hypothetical protein
MGFRSLFYTGTSIILLAILGYWWFSPPKELPLGDVPAIHRKVIWHWEDDFYDVERSKLQQWVDTVYYHSSQVLGVYPFPVHFFVHRSENAKEPVPWAHTQRGKQTGVHFHVNPDFEMDDFLEDWTAPHEISHLAIPFVGRDNSWFSEGFASYMQYQIMSDLEVYSDEEVQEKYREKFRKCKRAYDTELDFVAASDSLRKNWRYADFYWGGAKFFWDVNEALIRSTSTNLPALISKYQGVRKKSRVTILELCQILDSIAGKEIMVPQLRHYQTVPARDVFSDIK